MPYGPPVLRACIAMTIPEVHSRAKRLEARCRTMLSDVPEQRGNLCLAAKALLAMIRSFHRSDILKLDGA